MTVTDGNGCQATAAYTVTVHPLPEINITGDLEICKGECTDLTASGGIEYEWSNIGSNNYQCNGAFVGGLQGGATQSLYNISDTHLTEIASLNANNINGIAYYCSPNKVPFIYGMKMKGNTIQDATKANLVQINPINGNLNILGEIPQPPNPYGAAGTTGIMAYIADASSSGKYYFPAISALVDPFSFSVIDYTVYLGTIDLNNHGNGANVTYRPIGITSTCKPYMDACVNAFQVYAANPVSREPSGGIHDWALNEKRWSTIFILWY
ncbi:MAG: hypothetical protein U0T36_00115 [Saprospiraceae bacterium]